MKLFSSTSSPFARKVLIVAKEVGIYHQLQVIPTSVNPAISTAIDNLSPLNPLSKIPTLHVPGMGPLFGSSVIAQYIISTSQNNTILPHDVTRFAVLTREALADGASEAMLLMRFETALRPKGLFWKEFYDGQFAKVCRAFDEMEKHVENETKEDVKWDLGDIATLCALSYADLRFGDVFDWRVGRPVLAAWYIQQGDLRDSVKETALA